MMLKVRHFLLCQILHSVPVDGFVNRLFIVVRSKLLYEANQNYSEVEDEDTFNKSHL